LLAKNDTHYHALCLHPYLKAIFHGRRDFGEDFQAMFSLTLKMRADLNVTRISCFKLHKITIRGRFVAVGYYSLFGVHGCDVLT